MSLTNQLIRAAEYIKETGTPTPIAIRELWPEFTFSGSEATQLQQEGFGALVNPLLTSARRMESVKQSITIPWPNHEVQPATEVIIPMNIIVPKAEPRILSVTIRVLEGTIYDIRGDERKAVADFEVDDCSYVIERGRAAIRGQERHLVVFEYIRKQLETSGASQVRKLSEDEQDRIAHMLDLVKRGEEPFGEGPIEPGPIEPATPAPKFGPASQGVARAKKRNAA